MKKKKIVLITVTALFCLLLAGCSNGFARQQYNSTDQISRSEDNYAKKDSVFNPIDGGYSLIVSEFDGRETLWSRILKEEQSIAIDFSIILSKGQMKIVHVDADANVTTLIECSPDNSTEGFETKTVTLKKGQNRLKIVGYDCEGLELKMLFEEP